jgi:hypothetical protein
MAERVILFVGLNPSTADANQDDPTIRRCARFALREGFDWLYIGNLYAYRSTQAKVLRMMDDLEAVGPDNKKHLQWLTQKAEIVVAAWGAHSLCGYAHTLADWILNLPNCRVLGQNRDGSPKHPLYVRSGAELQDPLQ